MTLRKSAAPLMLSAFLFVCQGCSIQAGADLPTGAKQDTETENAAAAPGTQGLEEPDRGTVLPEAETEIQETDEFVPEPAVQTVTVTAVGDCTLGVTQTHGYAGSFHEYYDNNGEDYFFGGVRELFEEDDFTLINLECVLSESGDRVEKTWNLKGRPEYAGIMSNSSVEACSLGNNHTLDYGEASLEDTKNVLDEAGILYGLNEHVAAYTTESGIVVGIVSANLIWQNETRTGYVRDGIAALREQGAELVIACCHWGIEGDHYANEYQRDLAHQIIDWGADLVVGTHPHVLQGVELYNGRVICYSLGNFCFGGNRNPAVKDTAVFRQTFTFVDGVLKADVEADMIPYSISSITSRNDFRPTRTQGERKQQIVADLNSYSASYSDICFDEDGHLMQKKESD